jgi:hypothetical protein
MPGPPSSGRSYLILELSEQTRQLPIFGAPFIAYDRGIERAVDVMKSNRASRQAVKRLNAIRTRFEPAASREKLELLGRLEKLELKKGLELAACHSALCYVRAFPDTQAHFRAADRMLKRFGQRVGRLSVSERDELLDSGIAGTPIHYPFSYEVATWLARRAPQAVSIDWEETDDTTRLDELLEPLLLPAEVDHFDSGNVSSEEWVELVSANGSGSDFDWLLQQIGDRRRSGMWSQLYNAVDLPLTWELHDSAWSKSANRLPVRKVMPRAQGLRRAPRNVKREIERPVDSLHRVSARRGARLIDVAMASLAVRHRETYHFNFANPKEVYLADVGEGVSIAIFGLHQEHRFPLECTMGYLILSHGVPVGYGGSSIVFRQVNTGINIFDEYRGSEAAFLWTQVMRVYHHLVGCTRYIANPYQLGSGNDEALQSGAFWFYYRLGYRPVPAEIRELAQRELRRIRGDSNYRVGLPTLRQLSSCDMHLVLAGARASELFDERWIETSSMLATRNIAAAGRKRRDAVERLTTNLLRKLDVRSCSSWSANERAACRRLAPIASAADVSSWSSGEKRAMRDLLRAKGGESEADYARQLCRHDGFLAALRAACRRAH